jgi:hypothetical protein
LDIGGGYPGNKGSSIDKVSNACWCWWVSFIIRF